MTVWWRARLYSSAGVLVVIGLAYGCGRTRLVAPARDASAPSDSVDVGMAATGPTSQPSAGGLCPDGFTSCGRGSLCYDLDRAPGHCGACGNACAPGIACQAGRCQQYRCQSAVTFDVLPAVSTEPSSDYGATLGDFDRDGILDFVGPTGPAALMGILFGNGDGSFRPKSIAPAFAESWRAATADLNNDGWLDLASISEKQSEVSVRLGNGDPTTVFGAGTSYPTPSVPDSLLLADLDDDGYLDLVAGGARDTAKGNVRSWRGSASGTFASPVDVPVGEIGTFLVGTDWNHDGAMDLLFGTTSLRMLLGRHDGTYENEIACGLALGQPICAVIANFDSDPRPDVAVCSQGIFLDMNACNFTTVGSLPDWQRTPTRGARYAMSAVAADMNGDGKMDLVGMGEPQSMTDYGIGVYEGDGRGGFGAAATFRIIGRWSGATMIAGDFNRDRKLDLLVIQREGWQVLLNTCR